MTSILLETATLAAIYGVVTLSLNFQYGLTGLLNFGQGLLFAVGGYCVGIVYFQGWDVWLGIVAAPFVGALAGAILALPSRRLNDQYWALMTLAAAELFLGVMQNQEGIAGGTFGSYGIPRVEAKQLLPIMLALIVVLVFGIERTRKSQFGRLMRVAREDPVLLAAVGRDLFWLRLKVLAIGGAIAALGGVGLAYWLTIVAPEVFSLDQVVILWAMMIVGGRGNTYGALIGALVLEAIFLGTEYVPSIGGLGGEKLVLVRLMIVGTALIAMLLFRREGILPERRVRHGPKLKATIVEQQGAAVG
jgi:branched-chain amino acid transport system permease protein